MQGCENCPREGSGRKTLLKGSGGSGNRGARFAAIDQKMRSIVAVACVAGAFSLVPAARTRTRLAPLAAAPAFLVRLRRASERLSGPSAPPPTPVLVPIRQALFELRERHRDSGLTEVGYRNFREAEAPKGPSSFADLRVG